MPAGRVLAEQLVGGVLVRPVLPDLGRSAVADVEHQGVVVLQCPARPFGVDRVEADGVLVVGDDVVDLDPKGAAGQLHGPAEVAEHRINALVVAGELAAAGACQTMSGWNSSRRVCMSPLLKASYPRRMRSSLGCPMVAPSRSLFETRRTIASGEAHNKG
jgi:hypothetical protein